MKKISLLLVFIATCIVFSSCSKKDDGMATNSDSKFVGSYLGNGGDAYWALRDFLDEYFALACEQATYRRQGDTEKVEQLQRQIDQLLYDGRCLSGVYIEYISNGKVALGRGDMIFNSTSNTNVFKKLNVRFKTNNSEVADLYFTLSFTVSKWSYLTYTTQDNYLAVGDGNNCRIYLTDDGNGIRWHENGNDYIYNTIDYVFKDFLY